MKYKLYYMFSKKFNSDEEFEAFLEKQESSKFEVTKSDLAHDERGFLVGYWSLGKH